VESDGKRVLNDFYSRWNYTWKRSRFIRVSKRVDARVPTAQKFHENYMRFYTIEIHLK
jgi:hypothetical protein